MSDPAFKTMSVAEYLRTEEESPIKREYVDGFVYPLHGQAGTTTAHDLLTGNIFVRLHALARRAGCFAHTSDMRVTTADRRTYYYPDAMVTCEPRDDEARFKVAPCLLVEVLSRSTAHHDHRAKYHAYTSLPSLQTYLLVDQYARHVYAYQRDPEGWTLTQYAGQGVIPLPALDGELTLDEIYEGVLSSD